MSTEATHEIADRLNRQVADFQLHYQRLRNYHWNVRGVRFFELHEKFEELYLETAVQADSLAERVIQLGGHPLSTLREFLDHARLREDAPRAVPDAGAMLTTLVQDLETIVRNLRDDSAAALAAQDVATSDLLDDIAKGKDKHLWMLKMAR